MHGRSRHALGGYSRNAIKRWGWLGPEQWDMVRGRQILGETDRISR